MKPIIRVIIPAFNEEKSVKYVIEDIPKDTVTEIIVINNGSTDNTFLVAQNAGATVLTELQKGYGAACLKGINYIMNTNLETDIVVFLDADYSDHPNELPLLIKPIIDNQVSMVIGSRALGKKEKGSMLPQQIFGNWLATNMIRWLYNVKYTDLGPFRAITWRALMNVNMRDTNFGWTVEMQVKAAKLNIPFVEIPVSYRKRIGVSKVTGTLYGSVMAGYKIISTILKYAR